jgi:integrase
MMRHPLARRFVAGIRGVDIARFHDLRHEATTRLFEKGLNIMEVASITGHKDLRMLRRYTHLKAEGSGAEAGLMIPGRVESWRGSSLGLTLSVSRVSPFVPV